MSSRACRMVCAVAAAVLISLVSGVAGIAPWAQSPILRAIQRALVLLDIPISAVSLLLPPKGAWLFFVPAGQDRGIAPDLPGILTAQVIIGVPTYLAIFWLGMRLLTVLRHPARGTKEAGVA